MVVNSVHWFRKGLRLHDNPALQEALNGADTVRCVYILDPWFAGSANVGINRWRFLLESLEDLDTSLRKLNSRLFVVRGQPADVFPRLFKEWNVTRLTFEYDSEPYGKERDAAIIKMAQEYGVETLVRNTHTLYSPDSPRYKFRRPRRKCSIMSRRPTGLYLLRFGCLSCRVFYYNLRDLYMKLRRHSSPPLSLFGQLLWREFFYTAATNNPNFDRMEGNPICVQIPWDHNPEALAKWAEGRTGFPWIDAIMTQLRQEGWIHHLARHAVACFLTRGDLWISWESGMKVFEELLLDADWSVNAGSWMWLSCSAFFQQFFHCYCPVGFGRRTDPSGDYIRRYIPKLKDYPNRYIYEPWNAPESVQKEANCIVGVDYPKPMINHAESSRLNIERMKQVYQQLSHYRGLSLLASVPTIQEEAEPPMSDDSYASSSTADQVSSPVPSPHEPTSASSTPPNSEPSPPNSSPTAAAAGAHTQRKRGRPSGLPCKQKSKVKHTSQAKGVKQKTDDKQ
ncbi:hypothetical protein cypCar_00009625 [Cyprinus carpio]|nr:hypothetical protein cypCar_00009625 [Cyprinus carpio]